MPLQERTLNKYHYKESGLANVWLHGGGVTEYSCKTCGYKGIAIQKEAQLLQVIGLKLLMRPGPLGGQELRYLRKLCDLTQEKLASKLDVRRGAVLKWEAGAMEAGRPRQLHVRIVLLREFQRMLAEDGNLLGNQNNQRLKAFESEFVALSERIFRKPRLKLIMLEKHTDWEPQEKKVA
jgi:transcriptional regulator with XRE-family HTH domain